MIVFELLFWLSVAAIFHTYVLYPFLLQIMAKGKTENQLVYSTTEDLPKISILMSLFNEEEVIAEKIESIYNTNYPANKIEVIIGSDNSTDKTNEIVSEYANKYASLNFCPFDKRQGKGNIINQLFEKSKGDILILTDANVIFDQQTLFELIKHFKNEEIGLADTNMINKGLKKEGISVQEKAYISREVIIKNNESKLWGTMMGPFGGCYAIRKELYQPVPANFLVDDFYINMKVLENKKKAINSINARVYEDVSNNLNDELRRKIRIATGNFQNLAVFAHLLLPLNSGLSFSFLSHKVLRWIGPFFIILSLLSLTILSINSVFYRWMLLLHCFSLIIPFIDYLLRKIEIHIIILRFITHFYTMNMALMVGFFKSIKGVESNVWKPTRRNQ